MIVVTGANGFIGSRIVVRFLKLGRTDVAAVIHLGTCSDTMQTDDQSVMSSNVQYTQALWEWCNAADCPLVYASSAATYEDGSAGFDDEVEPGKIWPLNLYAQSKHQLDHWALQQTTEPPRWADIKYFNVSGPKEYHKIAWRRLHISSITRFAKPVHSSYSNRTGLDSKTVEKSMMSFA